MTAHLRFLALSGLLVSLGAGCREGVGPREPFALLAPDSVFVPEGDSLQLMPVLVDSLGDTIGQRTVAWASGDTSIVAVSADGVVRFRRPGRTTLAGLSAGLTARVAVEAVVHYVSSDAGGNNGTFVRWCGVTERGSAYCYPSDRQKGIPADSLVRVETPMNVGLHAVSVGWDHACGLGVDGRAYCWGSNSNGQLGTDSLRGCCHPPTWTAMAVQGGLTFRSITAGTRYSCALSPAGLAYCWGSYATGRLGDGDSTEALPYSGKTTPVAVVGGIAFRSITAGMTHTCGISSDSLLFCWGDNSAGELGLGMYPPATRPRPVEVPGLSRVVSGSAGAWYTCSTTADGTAYCWGANTLGQLGRADDSLCVRVDYETICNLRPRPVAGGLKFREVSVGSVTCGLNPVGAAYCWGHGAIGDGQSGGRTVPTAVAGGLAFGGISAGDHNACAPTESGVVYCWGISFGLTPQRLPYQRGTTPAAVRARTVHLR